MTTLLTFEELQFIAQAVRERWRSAAVLDTYVFKIKPQAKERPRAMVAYKGGKPYPTLKTPEKTRIFEADIAKATEEMLRYAVPGKPRLGMRLTMFNIDYSGDLSNHWKSVEDGMQGVAFENDGLFDYSEPLRIVDKGLQPQIWVEILRLE